MSATVKTLLVSMITVSVLFLPGCLPRGQVDPMKTMFIPIPEGINFDINDEAISTQALNSNAFKEKLLYFTDASGKPHLNEELGMVVEKVRPPVLVDGSLTICVCASFNGEAGVSLKPYISAQAQLGSGELTVIEIKGKMCKIWPQYCWKIDPAWVIIPTAYIQELYYADESVIQNMYAARVGGGADYAQQHVEVRAKLDAGKARMIKSQFGRCFFESYQRVLKTKDAVRIKTVKLENTPGSSAMVEFGGAQWDLLLREAKSDSVTVRFRSGEYNIPRGSYAKVDKWTAIVYRSGPHPGDNRVILDFKTIDEDFLKDAGMKLEFKDTPVTLAVLREALTDMAVTYARLVTLLEGFQPDDADVRAQVNLLKAKLAEQLHIVSTHPGYATLTPEDKATFDTAAATLKRAARKSCVNNVRLLWQELATLNEEGSWDVIDTRLGLTLADVALLNTIVNDAHSDGELPAGFVNWKSQEKQDWLQTFSPFVVLGLCGSRVPDKPDDIWIFEKPPASTEGGVNFVTKAGVAQWTNGSALKHSVKLQTGVWRGDWEMPE